MRMQPRIGIVLLVALACAVAARAGQQPEAVSGSGAEGRAAMLAARAGRTFTAARAMSVMGWVWAADNTPVPNAELRLRNVVSGRVEATTTANTAGEFTFEDLEGGTYVIELVDESGRVLAVGQVFSIAPGETFATFIKLSAPRAWFDRYFRNTAAAVLSSAAGLGVTAIAPTGRPVSREQ